MNKPSKEEIIKLEEISYEVRVMLVKMLTYSQSGHSAGPFGMVEILVSLYFHFMKIDPKFPLDPFRDKLVLSSGHICPLLYVCLAKKGFFPEEELFTLRKINSRLQGHPHNLSLVGIENSSGPLGQGVSVAIGMALYSKSSGLQNYTFIIGSDGELQEGQVWESAMFASYQKISRLIWLIDRNQIQIGGKMPELLDIEPLPEKFRSFGWEVFEIDGNNMSEVFMTISQALGIIEKPVVILAKTVPGKGVDFMEYQFEWHGKVPSKDQEEKALKSLERNYKYEKK